MIVKQGSKKTVRRRDIYKLAQQLVNYTQVNRKTSVVETKTPKDIHIHMITVRPNCRFSHIFHILRRITSTSKQRY